MKRDLYLALVILSVVGCGDGDDTTSTSGMSGGGNGGGAFFCGTSSCSPADQFCLVFDDPIEDFFECTSLPAACVGEASCDCATPAELSAQNDFDPCAATTSCSASGSRLTLDCRDD